MVTLFCLLYSFKVFKISSRSLTSIIRRASSNTKILGSNISAVARATFCFSPPDKSHGFSFNKSSSFNIFATSLIFFFMVLGNTPKFSKEKASSSSTVSHAKKLSGLSNTKPISRLISYMFFLLRGLLNMVISA